MRACGRPRPGRSEASTRDRAGGRQGARARGREGDRGRGCSTGRASPPFGMRGLLVFALAFSLGPSLLPGQAAGPDTRFAGVAALTEAKMREYGVPGVAIGIISGSAT